MLLKFYWPVDKVIFLGTQVDQLNEYPGSFATRFRLYYRLWNPLTGFTFPTATVSITKSTGSAEFTVPISTATTVPVSPIPAVTYTYTITAL